MKLKIISLIVLVFLLSACSFNVDVMTPVPASSPLIPETKPVSTPVAPISTVAPTPFPVPGPNDPMFSGAYFVLSPTDKGGLYSFPAGTKQVFIIWNYKNMRPGLTVKRVWFIDGVVWSMPEEPWDFAKYGAEGTISDVSVYDFDHGLPAGRWRVQMYIDNIFQPIGAGTSSDSTRVVFEIQPSEEAYSATMSPNLQWTAELFGERRVVINDASRNSRELYTGREIAYLNWFADNRHILIVDRDRSKQQSGTTIGVRDDLWVADVVTGDMVLVYRSDTTLGSTGGLYPSPNGKYIAGIAGSGFGDACFLDSQVIFFEMAGDYKSVKVIKQEQFSGVPRGADKVVYPVAVGTWESNTQYRVALNGTCGIDPSLMGLYLFDIPSLKANQDTSGATPFRVGDLGWGEVHGVVTDAVTGKVIAGALVTCEHSSYTSTFSARCSGSMETGIPGVYIFQNVFFHDTDMIKITVQASGYQKFEYTQNFFTINDLEANISLTRVP